LTNRFVNALLRSKTRRESQGSFVTMRAMEMSLMPLYHSRKLARQAKGALWASAVVIGIAGATPCSAGDLHAARISPKQALTEKRLTAKCRARLEPALDNIFFDPFGISAAPPPIPSFIVDVHKDAWNKLSREEKFKLMRDVACIYYNARVNEIEWEDFSASIPVIELNYNAAMAKVFSNTNDKPEIIDTFSGRELQDSFKNSIKFLKK